jgi:hypothetical protein
MQRNMILPCLLSGLFGTLFAVACGVVDNVGGKEANAEEVGLTKTIYEGTCTDEMDGWMETGRVATREEIVMGYIFVDDNWRLTEGLIWLDSATGQFSITCDPAVI